MSATANHPPATGSEAHESVAGAFASAMRAVAATGAPVVSLKIPAADALEFAKEIEDLLAAKAAARALVADLDNPEASLTWSCRECPQVSTCQAAGGCYCDEHSPGGGTDTTYAAPLRVLRALLGGTP